MKKIFYFATFICIVSVQAQEQKETRPAYLVIEQQLKKAGQLVPGQPFPFYDPSAKKTLMYSAETGVYDPNVSPRNNQSKPQSRPGNTAGATNNFAIVKDINTSEDANPANNSYKYYGQTFAVLKDVSYFSADNGKDGVELWRSDGTTAGTFMVKDINPGSAASNVSSIIVANNKLFFTASTDYSGQEMWTSDGTAGGTVLLKDINSGSLGSNPNQLTDVNGKVFFVTGNFYDSRLWSTDGTDAGTQMVKDLSFNGAGANYDPLQLTAVNNTLFFSVYSNTVGRELWRSDGTEAGTYMVKDIFPNGGYDDGPEQLTAYNNQLYFSANDGTGRKLWISDGTAANTTPAPGNNSVLIQPAYFFFLQPFTIFKNKLVFPGFTPSTGWELFKYDPAAGAVAVKNITPGTGNTNLLSNQLVSLNDLLYFSFKDSSGNTLLWKSTGNGGGTSQVVNLGQADSYNLFNANGTLLFDVRTEATGYELWKSDGTAAGTSIVKDIYEGAVSSNPYNNTNCNGVVLFKARSEKTGLELWKTDGTAAGTMLVKDVNKTTTSGSRPGYITTFNNSVVFNAYRPDKGNELWKSDGTAAGTSIIKELIPGENSAYPRDIIVKDNWIYFTANASTGFALYRSNGTASGTKSIISSINGYINTYFIADNGTIYYYIYNYATSLNQLWKTDGTAAGNVLLKDNLSINTYYDFEKGKNNGIVSMGNVIYFAASDNTSGLGTELWKSDGTPAGTSAINDIYPGGSSYPNNLIVYNNNIFFAAYNGTENALFRSDGTSGGTVQLKKVNPYNFCISNSELFFAGYSAAYGSELWKTDGTAAGTKLLKDINNGFNSSSPANLTNLNGVLYFTAYDDINGTELWKSNGTASKTKLVKDLITGANGSYINNLVVSSDKLFFLENGFLSISDGSGTGTHFIEDSGLTQLSYISNLRSAGNRLFFAGDSYRYGSELYSGNTTSLTFARSAEKSAIILPDNKFSASLMRNPVQGQLDIMINTKNEQGAQLTITDLEGRTILTSNRKLSAGSNIIHYSTSSWVQGLYLIKITCVDGSNATLKVLK